MPTIKKTTSNPIKVRLAKRFASAEWSFIRMRGEGNVILCGKDGYY